jgi:hypothetical protein
LAAPASKRIFKWLSMLTICKKSRLRPESVGWGGPLFAPPCHG